MTTNSTPFNPQEPTMKQFWLAAFVSLLSRLPPEAALTEADKALALCNQHWCNPAWAWARIYKHSNPVGTEFKQDPNLPPNNE